MPSGSWLALPSGEVPTGGWAPTGQQKEEEIPSLQGPTRSQVLSGGPLHRALCLPINGPSLTPQALSGRSLAASTPSAPHYPSISLRPCPSSQFECATCFLRGPRKTRRPKTFECSPNMTVPCHYYCSDAPFITALHPFKEESLQYFRIFYS